MANTGSILGKMGESFEDIGKDVAREVVQAPKDVAGKALESLGVSSGKKKQTRGKQSGKQGAGTGGEQTTPEQRPETQIAQAVARAALEEISGKNKSKQKEPSVWEKLQKEEEEKKEAEKKKKEMEAKQRLPDVKGKRARGDLYGIKAKKASAENRNVRQD